MKQLKMKQKNKKANFFQCYQENLAVSVLGNTLTGKGVIRAGEGVTRAGQNV